MNNVQANLLTSLLPSPAHPIFTCRLAIFTHLGNILVINEEVRQPKTTRAYVTVLRRIKTELLNND
jgi:hypothetical protein